MLSRNMFTNTAAIFSQYARVRVDTTRAAVDSATQYRRRYLDVDESEIAPAETSLYECGVEVHACLVLTNDWLRDQTRDRTGQPHEASDMLRNAEGK